MSVLMRSVSGIRGVVGEGLTPDVLLRHVKAFLEITGARKVVIGRDSRPTGPQVVEFVSGVCRLAGVDVVDAGLATTPTVELLVEHTGAGGGIIVTASHNPVEWNALKFLDGRGLFLGPDAANRLFALADANQFSWPRYTDVGGCTVLDVSDVIHIDGVLGLPFVDVNAIRAAHFKVALDAVNGAGSFAVPALLEALGCEVVRVHCTPDGTFPHGAEPLPENLVDLGNAVRSHKCVVGFALDPDADRCAIVDAVGTAIGEEYTLPIAVETVLEREAKPVCINLSSSRMTEDVAARFGVACSRAKVGEINVSLAMMDQGCVIGGEGNGGVILPALHYGRDSLVAVALVLDWMARHNASIEDWVASHPRYAMPKKKFSLGSLPVAEALARVDLLFSDWTRDDRDGLWFGKENSWVHVRASNTEPVVRVIAEAPTTEEAERLCALVEEKIRS